MARSSGARRAAKGRFSEQVRRWTIKVDQRANVCVNELVEEVVREVDRLSPVLTGKFRGNWKLGVDAYPMGTTELVDPSGTSTVASALALIPEKAAGHVYFYANNLPYAMRLEHGYSAKAPAGMVGITQVRFQAMVEAAAHSAKAQVA